MLNELHKYCSKYMNVKCSFMDFVDVIVARLLPPESYQSIRHKHEAKIMTFRTVLLKVIGKFTNYILSRRLNDVLNDDESVRLRPDMLPACKQEFNVILEAERNELGAKINAVQHGVPAGGREDHIYRDINERLQHQIKILLHEKAELAQRCNQLSQAYLAIKDIALGKEQELAGQAKLIEELQANGRLVKQMVKNQQEQKPPAYVMMAPQMMAPQILPQQALAPPATPTISKPNVVLGTAPPVAKQVQPAEESGEESGAESGQESGEASGEDDLQALVMAPDE
jgi:hypothetical protein